MTMGAIWMHMNLYMYACSTWPGGGGGGGSTAQACQRSHASLGEGEGWAGTWKEFLDGVQQLGRGKRREQPQQNDWMC